MRDIPETLKRDDGTTIVAGTARDTVADLVERARCDGLSLAYVNFT